MMRQLLSLCRVFERHSQSDSVFRQNAPVAPLAAPMKTAKESTKIYNTPIFHAQTLVMFENALVNHKMQSRISDNIYREQAV